MALMFESRDSPEAETLAAYTRAMAHLEAQEHGFSIGEDMQRHIMAIAKERGLSPRELLADAFGEPPRRPDYDERRVQALRFRAALARINAELSNDEFEQRFEEYWPERAAEARGEGRGETA